MSDLVRVGVIGAGRWGPNLIRNFHNHMRSVVGGVAEADAGRRRQLAGHYPDIRLHADADALFIDPDIRAVVIATPASTHATLATAALEAGKHCLVEKPLSDNAGDAERLCRLADARGLVLMVGHVFLHNPVIQRVKRYIDEGELGEVRYISMVRTNLGPAGIDVNVAWDLATHDISIANYWLDAAPLSVSARGGRWVNPDREDTIFATLQYPGDRLLNINDSWLSPRKVRDITVVGSRRMATVDDMQIGQPIWLHDKQIVTGSDTEVVDSFGSFRASVRDGDIVIPRVVAGEPLRAECDQFIECVCSGGRPVTDGWSALPVVRAVEAIDRSLKSGREEPIHP